jgi:phenylalanyl-tRNA synthetase alpha chain
VYRKDEIDRKHMNVFHQIDGLYLCEKSMQIVGKDTLVSVLIELTKGLFGEDIEYRVLDDSFPYTDPSAQIEIKVGNDWMEILGSGVVKGDILENL